MRELEEVNCEIRRIVNFQFPVSNRLRNLETVEYSQSTISQEQDNISGCRGGFLHNATYAWLSYGCYLVVFNVKIGESISNWTFRGIVTSVSQFPAQSGEFPLLLVGIDNYASKLKDSSGLLCIFDCTTSRVLRTIRMPCGIEQVCVVSGGAEWEEFNDKRPDNILHEMDGIACVVLRNLQHIMIDLRRLTWDIQNLSTVISETSPAEIDFLSVKQVIGRHQSNQERHAAYNLLNNRIEKHIGFNREDFESSPLLSENLTTAIISSTKIGCVISGCLGRVIIWQNDCSIGWISAPMDENMAVTHLALLEPTDDPRPFYYLWVVFQDESSKTPPILRMYAMLFERKYCDRRINLYFNLEADPSLKFESELGEGDRVINLCTVERETNPEQTESSVRRGEDNLLLIATNERVLLFDLNQWYKEQMPHTINECQNPNSILATYCTRSDTLNADSQVVSFAYVPLSLQEFPSNSPSSPEELFYPNSLSLEWVELSSTKLTFWMTRGIQADLLREMAMTGPIILIQPSKTFHRCLSVGLVPFNSEVSFASDQNAQREMLLSLCLEQRWSTFLVKCAVEWSDGSASYLYPTFLKWGVQRASTIKMIADRLCIPLFDQSGSSIGEADVKTLRFCSQQLECLSNVVGKLPSAAVDLTKQRKTLKRVSTYFQVLLWFYDVGLLPETQDLEEEGTLPISLALKVPYPYEKLSAFYKEKRSQAKEGNNGNSANENEEDLFIDELIMRECSVLKTQWEREGGTDTGDCYPPPSLQSLLRSYLTDCCQTEVNEISCKHQITIYLLMDLAMLLQRLYPAVDQLIKYPSAFKMSPSLIKLTQAFWLLDHEDYQGFLDMMTGQLVSDSDVKDWHHRLILRTLVRNNQHKLALMYLRVRKPPLSSMEEQSITVSLSVKHGLVQSAFHHRPPCHYEQLLTCFFRACKKYNKLNEILHLALDSEEEEVFVKFLEENRTEDLRLLYFLQRCRYTEAISGHSIRQYQSNFTKDIQSTTLSMLGAYDMTLPDVTKRFSTNTAVINLDVDLKARYPRPMSHCKSHDRLRDIYETVIAKARETYLRGEKCQVPFVSAPCMSLKLNNYSANMNCVLFPVLVHKGHGKRTVDQIYEGEDANANSMPDKTKRRKLSDGNVSPNRCLDRVEGSKESELTAVFATPLVKRKLNASMTKNNISETPQSILKIKQLIRNSTSPGIATFQTMEVIDGLSGNEKEKRVNRQIRFNINQSNNVLMYEDEEKKEEKEEKEEEEEENSNEQMNMSYSPNVSDNVFFSPNASNKSTYCESAVLSGNSNISSKIYSYARPRPSLRRSGLQSSVEFLQESCAKEASGSSANLSAMTSLLTPNAPKRRSSLLSTSIYSTTVLSSDSNIDISYSKRLESNSSSQWRSFIESDCNDKFTISSTPLTKSIVSQPFVNNDRAMEIDNDVEHMGSESLVSNVHKMENFNVPSKSKKFSKMERSGFSKSDFVERRESLKKGTEDKSQQSENKYKNGNIMKENSNLQNPCEEQLELSEFDTVAGSSLTVSDESDEELLRLRDYETDNDEHEEAFESLSTTSEDAQMQLENKVPISHSSELWNPGFRTERYDITKSNGLQKSMQMMDDIDFTDDETTSSRGMTPTVSDKADNNRNKEYSMPTVCSENVLYDMMNITEDESDSNREIEEPKTKNGKLSNLQEQYMMQNVKMEKTGESNQKSRKLDKRGSVSKKSINKVLLQTDVDDNESRNIHPNYKADSNKIEVSEESAKSREKLEIESSSKIKSNPVEYMDGPSVRMTRSRRASSIAKDTTDTLSQEVEQEMGRVTRLRRGNSMTKDIKMNSPLRNIEKPPRLRRANSMMKDLPIDSPSRNTDTEEPPRLRKMISATSNSLTDLSSQETDHEKPLRLRRASSTTNDIKISTPSKKSRNRRASSLAKDVLMDSVPMDGGLKPVTLLESGSSDTQSSIRRGRRSTSVAKEILQIEIEGSESGIKDEPAVRRSTRLTSAKKELQMDTPKNLTRSESASSFIKLMSNDEENKDTKKKSLRARTSSVSSDKTTPSRFLRSSTSDLDKEELKKLETKTSRRRGSSVPKEIMVETGRRHRSSSIIKEIIPEVVESPKELKRLRSSATQNTEHVVNRSMTNTRSRSVSILSIPEELEEILSPSLRETRSARKEILQSNTRERRASSADVLHKEVKRRIRNIRASIATEPIMEEHADSENTVELEEDKKMESEVVRNILVSKRKTVKDTVEESGSEKDTVKQKRGRPRKTSVNQESKNVFSFSQSEKTGDVPLDEKDTVQVPCDVSPPPQIRSKTISPFQHHRKMSSFIPGPYQEGEQRPAIQKPHDILIESGPYARVTINTFGSRFRNKFNVPKRSRSRTD